jgi:hypothetical protein
MAVCDIILRRVEGDERVSKIVVFGGTFYSSCWWVLDSIRYIPIVHPHPRSLLPHIYLVPRLPGFDRYEPSVA